MATLKITLQRNRQTPVGLLNYPERTPEQRGFVTRVGSLVILEKCDGPLKLGPGVKMIAGKAWFMGSPENRIILQSTRTNEVVVTVSDVDDAVAQQLSAEWPDHIQEMAA